MGGESPHQRPTVLPWETIPASAPPWIRCPLAPYPTNSGNAASKDRITRVRRSCGLLVRPWYWWQRSLTLSRIPIDTATATALGAAQVVADNQLIDDFALAVDKHTGTGAAYLATMYDNSVVRVVFGPPPSAGPGVKTLVAGNLTSTGVGLCTVVVFGRRPQDRDVLYAAVGQGGSESAKIVALDLSQL